MCESRTTSRNFTNTKFSLSFFFFLCLLSLLGGFLCCFLKTFSLFQGHTVLRLSRASGSLQMSYRYLFSWSHGVTQDFADQILSHIYDLNMCFNNVPAIIRNNGFQVENINPFCPKWQLQIWKYYNYMLLLTSWNNLDPKWYKKVHSHIPREKLYTFCHNLNILNPCQMEVMQVLGKQTFQ